MSYENRCDAQAWVRALKEKNWTCEPKDENEAYSIQRRITGVAKEVWGTILGWKAALTNENSQRTFGGGPIYGPLFEKGILGDGSRVELRKLSDPLLEPEVFFCQGSFFVAFEIPDNRYGKPWNQLNYLMLIADLAGSNKVVVGKQIKTLEGMAVLKGPDVDTETRVDVSKILKNKEFLENNSLEGCLLLGTVIPPVRPREGSYTFECCGSQVSMVFL